MKQSPNFSRLLSGGIVKDTSIFAIVMEKHTTDFKLFIERSHKTIDLWRQIIFQWAYAIYIMNVIYGVHHNDLHWENIMIDILDDPIIYEYNFFGKQYYIKTKYILKIIDFGLATIDKKTDKYGDKYEFMALGKLIQNKDKVEKMRDKKIYEIATNHEFFPTYEKNLKSYLAKAKKDTKIKYGRKQLDILLALMEIWEKGVI